MDQSLVAFSVLCLLLTIAPGADTALVLKSSMTGKQKHFVATILGICVGLLFHATMSSLGLSAILKKSAELYAVVKYLGAAYLIYLGLQSLFEAWFRKDKEDETSGVMKNSEGSFAQEFRKGLLTNTLNPKVAVFYLTFLPQFVNVKKNVLIQSLGLSMIHILMNLVWLYLVGSFVMFFKAQFAKKSVKRKIETLTGFALLGFGIKLGTD
ncbi:hypothetical protein AZI85_12840 [Bdellovibrio bacteriovorus]|uniref:Threonine transporter RhtB n=1 Tax=Bdellovibrio bacteriovorus TaxID=959 RepID=A0A150WBF5_BDEBC|nr:LysE family translocator [Bdellovibrio bacteriovorus]KYG60355.1 hypothetical protein AZI85_12840 [Bdellovibrio bacteriovorus]